MGRFKLISITLCLSLIGFSFLTSPVFGQAKLIELKYSIFFPAPHKHSVLATEWGKEIEKRTDGKVKVTMFYAGTLTPAPGVYDGVVKGISDVGMSVFAYTRGKFPLLEVIDLPLGAKSGWAATRLINDFNNKFTPKELEEVKVMYLHAHGPGILHTKKAVNKLEDLKGMKIRCTGMAAKIVTALGGAPVAMPMGETYDALSRGVVEGSMAPTEALQGWKWGEVVKFTTENFGSSYSTGFFVVMNKEKWNDIPPDIQKIIEKVNEEYIEKTGKAWDEIDKAGRDFILKLDNKIIPLSQKEDRKWAKAVKPLLDDYVKSMKEKGLPGEEALKFCLDQLKKLQ
ncbi:MAG: TRAP transporter substrate-binding protein [Thermodesulfobacteriota bacterium]